MDFNNFLGEKFPVFVQKSSVGVTMFYLESVVSICLDRVVFV